MDRPRSVRRGLVYGAIVGSGYTCRKPPLTSKANERSHNAPQHKGRPRRPPCSLTPLRRAESSESSHVADSSFFLSPESAYNRRETYKTSSNSSGGEEVEIRSNSPIVTGFRLNPSCWKSVPNPADQRMKLVPRRRLLELASHTGISASLRAVRMLKTVSPCIRLIIVLRLPEVREHATEEDRSPESVGCARTICPKCGHTIMPAEIRRIDFDRMRCPKCEQIFEVVVRRR